MKTQTSPIGKKFQRGFTLLEMLVTLTIVSLLISISVPIYTRTVPRLKVMSATHKLATELRRAHSVATTQKRDTYIVFHPSEPSYTSGGNAEGLAVDISLETSPDAQAAPTQDQTVHFYPDGSATPVLITLSNEGRQSHIQIDGFTGRISTDEN